MSRAWYDWLVPARGALTARWRRRPERPWVFGHRGARAAAPENTFAAFELAIDQGADGIEIDVRLDGDGRVVVLHDVTLERVTGGANRRSVETLTAAELAKVDVGAGERIPLLTDVLDWAGSRDVRVNVEVKSDVTSQGRLIREVTRLLGRRPDSPERVILSSFHPRFVAELSRRSPSVAVGWLVHEGQFLLRQTPGHGFLGACAVHPEARLISSHLLDRWRAAGLVVNAWTVNDPVDAIRLSTLGIDTLITDEPKRILAALSGQREPTGGAVGDQR